MSLDQRLPKQQIPVNKEIVYRENSPEPKEQEEDLFRMN